MCNLPRNQASAALTPRHSTGAGSRFHGNKCSGWCPLSWRDKRRIWAGTPKRQTQIVQMYPPGVPWSNGGTTPQASVLGLARPAN